MASWLGKTEPFKYSLDDLFREGRTRWDGVRSAEARNNLRAMEHSDHFWIYHSNEGLAVVGLARVDRAAYRDPTAPEGEERWLAVDIVPVLRLPRPVSLAQIKADPLLQGMALVRQSRLSVCPVRPEEHARLRVLGGLDPA